VCSIPKLSLQRIGIRPQSAAVTGIRPRSQQSGKEVRLLNTPARQYTNTPEASRQEPYTAVSAAAPNRQSPPPEITFDAAMDFMDSTRSQDGSMDKVDIVDEVGKAVAGGRPLSSFNRTRTTTEGKEGAGVAAAFIDSVRVDERNWCMPQQRYATANGAIVDVISRRDPSNPSMSSARKEAHIADISDPWQHSLGMSVHQHPLRAKMPSERPRSAPGSQADTHGRIHCRMVDEAKQQPPHYYVRNMQAWPMHQEEEELPQHILEGASPLPPPMIPPPPYDFLPYPPLTHAGLPGAAPSRHVAHTRRHTRE